MMRFFSLAAVLLLFVPVISAQELLDKIADECCVCIDSSAMDSTEVTTAQLGICMLTKALPYKKELKKRYHLDLDRLDRDKGEEFGQLIGVHLITRCPRFAELAMKLAHDDDDDDEVPPPPPDIFSVPGVKTFGGTVQETRPSMFLTVVVKSDEGATYELLLLDHVPHADLVYADPAKARGLSATWSYEEREFLEPYSRTYRTYRVIRGIEKREP